MDMRFSLRCSLRFPARAVALFAATLALACLLGLPANSQEQSSQTEGAEPKAAVTVSKANAKKAKEAYQEGVRSEHDQDWQAAYEAYANAAELDPSNRQYAIHREMARSRAVQTRVDLAERDAVAGRLTDARKEL